MKATKVIKVCLSNDGDDQETPWAQDLGPVSGQKDARKVRLVNVPFLHAKPTWGDVIVVHGGKPFPTWDDAGVHEDGGRYAMIIAYAPRGDVEECFEALCDACAELDIVCEGATTPRPGKPGYAYLAVKYAVTDRVVMKHLVAADLPCQLVQIHPPPAKRARPAAPSKTRVAARR